MSHRSASNVGRRLFLRSAAASSKGGSRMPARIVPGLCATRRALVTTTSSLSGRSTGAAALAVGRSCDGDEGARMSRFGFGLAAATAAATVAYADRNRKADCTAIAAVVGSKDDDARELLLDGLTVLKNRGYDGAGLATMSKEGKGMSVTKFAGKEDKADSIDLVKEHSRDKGKGHSAGIAHTRWATHGGKTDVNAHPHLDSSGKIAVVHNGALNNANLLRQELTENGHYFTSQTDTEVIAKLIGHYKEMYKLNIKEATEQALYRCDGTWGLVVMCSDEPDELVAACNGSSLVIGVSDNRTFVASETSAFNKYTKNFITMRDGEIAVVHSDGRNLDLSRMQKAPQQEQPKLSPEPYPHWTLKEISEQPESIARALRFGGRLTFDRVLLGGMDKNVDTLSKIDLMVLTSCGSSLYAAQYGERLMKQMGCFKRVFSIDATDMDEDDLPTSSDPKETGLIAVSQSGETKDVQDILDIAIEKGNQVISVVNTVGSSIARATKLGVYCHAGLENAVTSTKVFTSEVVNLALMALWFRDVAEQKKGLKRSSTDKEALREALMRLPITFGMALKTREQCKKIAEQLNEKEHCFVLGKGFGEPIAMEGALKLKEMGYLHAEGYSGGALKHGPFAMIEGENGTFGATPIIMLVLDDVHAHHMRTACEEVKARGAKLIIITDKPSLADELDDDPIVIPTNGPLTALGAVVPMQLIAYELAMLRGIDPDTPRHLAKTFRA